MIDGPLSEDDVAALLEGMRARGELGYKSEEEYRKALKVLSREELEGLLVVMWKRFLAPRPH